jgi:hypothetical protein
MQYLKLARPNTKGDMVKPHLKKEINDEYKLKFLDKYVELIIRQIYFTVINHHLDKTKVYKYDIITDSDKGDNLGLLSQLNNIFAGRKYLSYSPFTSSRAISWDDIAPFPDDYGDAFTEDDCNQTMDWIIGGLRELFPDFLIQTDPLKTYILIDWN